MVEDEPRSMLDLQNPATQPDQILMALAQQSSAILCQTSQLLVRVLSVLGPVEFNAETA